MPDVFFRGPYAPQGVTAEAAAGELTRLYQEVGTPTAVHVVDAARPDDAPLHPAFEWDDRVAAELHRQHQATQLICSVYFQVSDADPTPIRMFMPVQLSPNRRGMTAFVPTASATPEQFAQVLERWRLDIAALRRRLESLGLFTGQVPDAMDALADAVADVAA